MDITYLPRMISELTQAVDPHATLRHVHARIDELPNIVDKTNYSDFCVLYAQMSKLRNANPMESKYQLSAAHGHFLRATHFITESEEDFV